MQTASRSRSYVRVVDALDIRQRETHGVAIGPAGARIRRTNRRIERKTEPLDVVVAETLDEQRAAPLVDDQVLDRRGVGCAGVRLERLRGPERIDDRDCSRSTLCFGE